MTLPLGGAAKFWVAKVHENGNMPILVRTEKIQVLVDDVRKFITLLAVERLVLPVAQDKQQNAILRMAPEASVSASGTRVLNSKLQAFLCQSISTPTTVQLKTKHAVNISTSRTRATSVFLA